jgi:hypothetical protein
MFSVISGDLRELVEYRLLAGSICLAVATPDYGCQLLSRFQTHPSPHLRLPASRLLQRHAGSIFDEATTHCSVANMVRQCDRDF